MNVRRVFVGIIILLFAAMPPSLADAQQSAGTSSPVKGDLGAKLITVTPELARERHLPPIGALVTEVAEGSAAAKANIAVGDVVQSINDHPVLRAEDVQAVLDPLAPGAEVSLSVMHGGQFAETKVTLLAPPAPPTPLVTGNPMLMLDTGGHMALIRGAVFTGDGQQLVSAADDKVVRIWDVKSGKTVRTIRGDIGAGSEGKIFGMALSPDQRWLAVGGYFDKAGSSVPCCGDIRLYDFTTGRLVRLLKGHTSAVNSLRFSPDGRRLISGSHDQSAIIWDVATGELLHRLEGHKAEIYAVGFSPDGQRVVTGSYDHTLRLWRTDNGRLVKEMTGHGERVFRLAIRRTDGLIASGDDAGEIRLWDGRTGAFLRTLARQDREVGALVFSPDGTRLLSTSGFYGSGRDAQHVWDVKTGKELVTYGAHDNTVLAAAISADGRLAATAGGNKKEIHIWELTSGRRVNDPDGKALALAGMGATTWAVGWSGDGKTIAWGNAFRYSDRQHYGPLEVQLRLPGAGESLGAPELIAASGAADFVRETAMHGNLRPPRRKLRV